MAAVRPAMSAVARAGVGLSVCALALVACGSAKTADSPQAGHAAPAARGSGPVDVLYAGSLVTTMDKQIGPRFQAATGYTLTGFAGGSEALATQIKGKVRQGDVFVSASPKVNSSLEGAANGGWVSWYATFADSPLVLGYDPHSRFAQRLRTEPWYKVVAEPGFLLGRTDPATDPKGKLGVEALQHAAAAEREPALAAMAGSSAGVYPEETLVGRLQSGQLDAGFFYSSEAKAAGIPTVPLAGVDLGATYTVTVLDHAPHPAAAAAFVEYLLGPAGRSVLAGDGFELVTPPKVSGSGVPAALSGVVPGR